MFTLKKLSFLLTVCLVLHVSLFGQVTNNVEPQKENGFDRKSNFNVEELKVRWKKAALENCPGVPCTIVSPPPAPSFTCGTSTVTDIDNNIYNTVLIGNQCWTKQNLRVRKYNDGSAITFDTSGGTTGDVGETWTVQTVGAHTLYGHDSTSTPTSNLTNYGYLYNWYAVSDVRNICPTGWRVPSDSDWNKLVIFADPTADTLSASLIQSDAAAIKLMSTSSLWSSPPVTGTDDYGFSILPGGARSPAAHFGEFVDESIGSFYWTSTNDTSVTPPIAYFRTILDASGMSHSVIRSTEEYDGGGSIRCIKN
jgi:uncharacterized protein (TIGR02145 family)